MLLDAGFRVAAIERLGLRRYLAPQLGQFQVGQTHCFIRGVQRSALALHGLPTTLLGLLTHSEKTDERQQRSQYGGNGSNQKKTFWNQL